MQIAKDTRTTATDPFGRTYTRNTNGTWTDNKGNTYKVAETGATIFLGDCINADRERGTDMDTNIEQNAAAARTAIADLNAKQEHLDNMGRRDLLADSIARSIMREENGEPVEMPTERRDLYRLRRGLARLNTAAGAIADAAQMIEGIDYRSDDIERLEALIDNVRREVNARSRLGRFAYRIERQRRREHTEAVMAEVEAENPTR